MGYSLEQFCADARAALERDSGPAGREVLTRHLETLLIDPDFIAAIHIFNPKTRRIAVIVGVRPIASVKIYGVAKQIHRCWFDAVDNYHA